MRRKIVQSLTVVAALSACAVAAPTAFAHSDIGPVDIGVAGPVSGQTYSVAPPDTSKASVVPLQFSPPRADLSTPDAKAAAADPAALAYMTPPTWIKAGSGDGLDWGDAGIGVGGVLAVVALAGGGLVLASRRRTTHASVSPATS
jgi:hypothetical protein